MIYLSFYKAAAGNWIDYGIALRTWSKYSHVEVVFASPVNPDASLKHATCFAASPRDKGTRFKEIDLTNGNWEVVRVPWVDRVQARKFCERQNGLQYDIRGVLSFVLPFLKPQKDHWFCSEVAGAMIESQGFRLPKEPQHMSPDDLFQWLVQYKHAK